MENQIIKTTLSSNHFLKTVWLSSSSIFSLSISQQHRLINDTRKPFVSQEIQCHKNVNFQEKLFISKLCNLWIKLMFCIYQCSIK